MNRLSFSILFLAFFFPASTLPQTTFERTYGGGNEDGGSDLCPTSDGGFIVVGYTTSFGTGQSDVYLVKTDVSGTPLWTRTYGGSSADSGLSVLQTPDGGYVVAGSTRSFAPSGWPDAYLIRTDPSGDTLWTRTYGSYAIDVGTSVQWTADGSYAMAGHTRSFGAGGDDFYLVRTGESGNTLWTRTYGGPYSEKAWSLQQTADNGYIIAGWTGSFGADPLDIYLVRTDPSGDTLWTRTYGGDGDDWGYSVQQTADGGYIIAGTKTGPGIYDAYLIKTDPSGDTLWTQTYGGDGLDGAWSVQQTLDGGYIVAGITGSFGAGSYDVYLVKTDASGNTLWTQTYGGSDYDEGFSVRQAPDGGYVIAGYTESYGAGSGDAYLIKTDEDGLVGIGSEKPHAPGVPRSFSLSQNYPNPFNPSTTIRFGVPASAGEGTGVRIEVFNLRGQRVRTLVDDLRDPGSYEVLWDGRTDRGERAGSGIYLYRIRSGEFRAAKKMVVTE